MSYPSKATTGASVMIKRGDGASPEVFTTISEVNAIKQNGAKLNFVEATNMDSQGNYGEYKPTTFDPGTYTVTVNYVPSDASQKNLQSDYDAKVLRNFEIVIPGADGGTWSFSAYVAGVSRSYEVDKLLVMDLELRVSGKPTFA